MSFCPEKVKIVIDREELESAFEPNVPFHSSGPDLCVDEICGIQLAEDRAETSG
jgi:hypothetical protein